MTALQLKACTKCSDTLPIHFFRENPRYAGGRVNWCNACTAAYTKAHYSANRERIAARNAAWHLANKERRNQAMRDAYAADPAGHSARVAEAKARNPAAYRERAKLRARENRANRIDVRLRSRISSQFRYCLATGKGGRTTASLLGYSIQELRTHLERQFLKGMTWDNMGEWHIDHIVPLASFTIAGPDDPELRRAWALPNLRPLWAADNIAKKDKRTSLL